MADSKLTKELATYGELSEDTIMDAVEIIESVGGTVVWNDATETDEEKS